MALRVGPGPVFVYECLVLARRWQTYVARALFVAILFVSLLVVYASTRDMQKLSGTSTVRALAQIGVQFYYAIIGTELALLLLAAPAMTAGTICIDKARGTLVHMLVTDLSATEIVLGKLLARLLPVLGLVAAGVPVLFLASLLGGIDTEALIGATLVLLGVGVCSCSLALLLSVLGTKTYEVLLATYIIVSVALILHPAWLAADSALGTSTMPNGLAKANPFYLAFAVYAFPDWYGGSRGSQFLQDVLAFLGGCLGLSLLFVCLAALSLRWVVRRQGGLCVRRSPWRWLRPHWLAPSLDRQPVLWREWHRKLPSRWTAFVWGTYWIGSGIFTFLVIATYSQGRRAMELGPFTSAFQVSIGMLLVVISAATSLSEERTRGSLDLLMTTPLSTFSIVWGKWWASVRWMAPLAILPTITVMAVGLSSSQGEWTLALFIAPMVLSYGLAWSSIGLALATWIKRFGWAVTASVAAYLVVTVGVILMAMLTMRHDSGRFIACLSPFFGPGELTANAGHSLGRDWLAYPTVIVVNLIAAAGGFSLAWITFDRCLGRMTLGRRGRSSTLPPTSGAKRPYVLKV